MAKKSDGLGKRALGLFIRTEEPEAPQLSEEELAALAAATEPAVPAVEVDSSQINAADVIRSIYAQGDFSDDTSLFRLDGFISSLPREMPMKTKQGSISGILKYSGINIAELIDDGQRRMALLLAAKDQLKDDNLQREQATQSEIEQMKVAIQEAERQIAEDKKTTEQSCNAIEGEASVLKALLDFAEGVANVSEGG